MVETIGCREGRHFICVKLRTISVWGIPCRENTALRAVMIDGEVVEVSFPGSEKTNPQQVGSSHRQVEIGQLRPSAKDTLEGKLALMAPYYSRC